MLDWNRLICELRCPRPGKAAKPSPQEMYRTAFQTDYDRIIFSESFRRLARKTQVHPMVPNDHVHNRLTHSLEVASVGRSFGNRLSGFLQMKGQLPEGRTPDDLSQILQAACLVHDIGNPPFGHAGEYAIRAWTADYPERSFGTEQQQNEHGLTEIEKWDWKIFEGNAQGFRLAARADNADSAYLRLTYSSLGAMIKYPWCSSDEKAKEKRKYNVFESEKPLFEEMFQHMGLGGDSGFRRHPLSYLTEAADDICYNIADLEDAVSMNILDSVQVSRLLSKIANLPDDDLPLPALRSLAIGNLIDCCWQVFTDRYDQIMAGEMETDLVSGLPTVLTDSLFEIEDCYKKIFADKYKIAVEVGAYQCLGRILDVMCRSVRELVQCRDIGRRGFVARCAQQMAWGDPFVRQNQHQSYSWWLHQILDLVSGMTDNYAKQFSKDISGS